MLAFLFQEEAVLKASLISSSTCSDCLSCFIFSSASFLFTYSSNWVCFIFYYNSSFCKTSNSRLCFSISYLSFTIFSSASLIWEGECNTIFSEPSSKPDSFGLGTAITFFCEEVSVSLSVSIELFRFFSMPSTLSLLSSGFTAADCIDVSVYWAVIGYGLVSVIAGVGELAPSF